MKIKQKLLPKNKYVIKCPYAMTPKGICVHNTANDASAENEISYMTRNDKDKSYHIAVDDIEAIQAIPFDRNAWHAGDGRNGEGNRNYIAIEICYSRSGGEKYEKAEENAIEVIVQLLNQYGWGIDHVKKHQDFSGKYCPHRILDEGWYKFIELIKKEMTNDVKVNSRSSKKELIKEFQFVSRELKHKDKNGNLLNVDGSYGPLSRSVVEKYYLKNGDVNTLVGLAQKILKSLGFYKGDVDNSFGPLTDKAVRSFQKKYSLKVDGFVGPNTWSKIFDVI